MAKAYRISKNLDRVLTKLQKKDKQVYENVLNKMNEILNNPDIDHYKNLRYNLKEYKSVHIGHFVLVFRFDKTNDIVFFTDFDHHDNIYR